jgi:polynucleotide 5'-hydroxyl-kinase GRC3/NOL9
MSGEAHFSEIQSSVSSWLPVAPVSSLCAIGWEKAKVELVPKRKRCRSKKRKETGSNCPDNNDSDSRAKVVNESSIEIDTEENQLLKLSPVDDIYLSGHANIYLVKGHVTLFGYNLEEGSKASINYPSWSSSISLKASKDSIVRVQKNENQGKSCVANRSSTIRPIIIPNSWISACEKVLEGTASKVLICGAKGVGKSTLLQYMVNRHLSRKKRVMVLDCDVGQPEFNPPGMLSLTEVNEPILSPPHLHMHYDHLKAYFFGYTTSRGDPSTYIAMISNLFDSYQRNFSDVSLVINTDGWTKGFGFEILTTIIQKVGPNHVIQLQGQSHTKSFGCDPTVLDPDSMIFIESSKVASGPDIKSEALRTLRLSSYFLRENMIWDSIPFTGEGVTDEYHLIANELAARKPYVVPMDSIRCEMPRIASEEISFDVLNGSIVGLGVDNSQEAIPSCVGLGIVRSVDHRHRLYYILSPLALEKLRLVNVLLMGGIQLPIVCVYRGIYSEALPYMVLNSKNCNIGEEVMKSRQNIGRKAPRAIMGEK